MPSFCPLQPTFSRRVTLSALADKWFTLVLGALDADGDLVISPQEITAAPSALRRLDLNHDGKLSPEECGFSTGGGTKSPPAQKRFMLANPVLAALDADRDGEISKEELRKSSEHLRVLDRDRDGSLTPNEVMPGRVPNMR